MSDASLVGKRFKQLAPYFDERLRRVWAAAEADSLGFGGAVAVERSTGVSRRAIAVGRADLAQCRRRSHADGPLLVLESGTQRFDRRLADATQGRRELRAIALADVVHPLDQARDGRLGLDCRSD